MDMEFVLIQPGTFLMGSPNTEENRSEDEILHEVTLTKPFYMQTTPVTQAQWQVVMESNPSYFKGEQRPVESVSWNMVQEFIRKLNQRGEGTYRLPTEAEWEYACRAGTTTPFGVGNGVDIDSTQINFDGDFFYGKGEYGPDRKTTTPVKSFEPNAWGLYDMHGNVCEWCQDWFRDYSEEAAVNPSVPNTSEHKVLRGGSWYDSVWGCRSASRRGYSSWVCGNRFGFRLVKEYSQTLSEIDLLKLEIKELKERLSAVEVKL